MWFSLSTAAGKRSTVKAEGSWEAYVPAQIAEVMVSQFFATLWFVDYSVKNDRSGCRVPQ